MTGPETAPAAGPKAAPRIETAGTHPLVKAIPPLDGSPAITSVSWRLALAEDHLIAAEGGGVPARQEMRLIEICAGLTEKQVRKLAYRDLTEIRRLVFFGRPVRDGTDPRSAA